jgi:hypothetical protein
MEVAAVVEQVSDVGGREVASLDDDRRSDIRDAARPSLSSLSLLRVDDTSVVPLAMRHM